MAEHTTEPHSTYLQELKAAAEAQMRRPAPNLYDDAGPNSKKQKTDDLHDESKHIDGPVSRYAYAASDTLVRGCTAFLGSCGFRRERSSTKEMLDVLNKALPEGTKLQLVKVGCNGLVVITAEPAAGQHSISPTAVVQDILQRIESSSLQPTKFCQRIMPAELTCTLSASALKAALTTVVKAYLAKHNSTSSSTDDSGQQQPLEFAVAYKNRDNVTLPGKQQGQKETQPGDTRQQEPQQQQALQVQHQQQQQQRQQQQAVSGALQPVPHSELVDRGRAIHIAAAVMQECCKDTGGAKVNLVNPQVVLLLDVIPLARHQLTCAVAAVPASMVVTKPKLAIKPTGTGAK